MLSKNDYVAKQVLKKSLTPDELNLASRLPPIETYGDQDTGTYSGSVMGISLGLVENNHFDGLSEIRLKGVEILIEKFGYPIESTVFRGLADKNGRTSPEPGYFRVIKRH